MADEEVKTETEESAGTETEEEDKTEEETVEEEELDYDVLLGMEKESRGLKKQLGDRDSHIDKLEKELAELRGELKSKEAAEEVGDVVFKGDVQKMIDRAVEQQKELTKEEQLKIAQVQDNDAYYEALDSGKYPAKWLAASEDFIIQYGKDHPDMSWEEVFSHTYRLDGRPFEEKGEKRKKEEAGKRKEAGKKAGETIGAGVTESEKATDDLGLEYPENASDDDKKFLDRLRRTAHQGL